MTTHGRTQGLENEASQTRDCENPLENARRGDSRVTAGQPAQRTVSGGRRGTMVRGCSEEGTRGPDHLLDMTYCEEFSCSMLFRII